MSKLRCESALCVAEHLLDEADVCAAFVHQRGHRVTVEMAGAGLAQLRRVDPVTVDIG